MENVACSLSICQCIYGRPSLESAWMCISELDSDTPALVLILVLLAASGHARHICNNLWRVRARIARDAQDICALRITSIRVESSFHSHICKLVQLPACLILAFLIPPNWGSEGICCTQIACKHELVFGSKNKHAFEIWEAAYFEFYLVESLCGNKMFCVADDIISFDRRNL